ncbi:hypothetical protein [Aliivibrio fischeri]|uniref:hypothetical protein n=1 Tax=Aliivibrio fischeri TaxID=668 RepID=UPI000A728147|nr:hypothetical protein [Aliivibrio fischeri]USR97905.1 hypothetical protein AVFI_15685 [Aliivibrio fischeri ATCC 7744 = JCM 18803 = DSM 507]GGK20698.1 hypothetical protein GCM10007987_00760 [Aliivibrio fischeri]
MISILYKTAAILLLICPLVFILGNVYLSVKLKSKKIELIKSISNAAPKQFKDRASLVMTEQMPWVAGSAIVFIWFSYPILRFIWGIKKDEITQWKVDIKNIFGKFFLIYFITITCVNLGMASILLIIVDESLFSHN